ncbi:MAG: hypothetical protein ACI8UZ_001373 [Akkermansiaceae bacterium]|jgi:hypothetical protein
MSDDLFCEKITWNAPSKTVIYRFKRHHTTTPPHHHTTTPPHHHTTTPPHHHTTTPPHHHTTTTTTTITTITTITTKRSFEIFTASDFIAAALIRLPPKGQQTVRSL